MKSDGIEKRSRQDSQQSVDTSSLPSALAPPFGSQRKTKRLIACLYPPSNLLWIAPNFRDANSKTQWMVLSPSHLVRLQPFGPSWKNPNNRRIDCCGMFYRHRMLTTFVASAINWNGGRVSLELLNNSMKGMCDTLLPNQDKKVLASVSVLLGFLDKSCWDSS